MSNYLTVFNFKGRDTRIVKDENNNPWWIAKDVCEILKISKHRDAVQKLDDDERGSLKVDTLGGPQEMITVNEPGLYRLIMRSNKPEAKQFQRWLTHEVLPEIRKTGSYNSHDLGSEQFVRLENLFAAFLEVQAEENRMTREILLGIARNLGMGYESAHPIRTQNFRRYEKAADRESQGGKVRFTIVIQDEEREIIRNLANEMRMTMTSYILAKVLSDRQQRH